jgi:prolyl oligopeptidase
VVDGYHGTQVADPYRWLEELDSPRTTEWVKAENDFTLEYLSRLHDRDAIQHRLTELFNYSRTDLPWREASGQIFFEENNGLQSQPAFYVGESLDDARRVVIDPNEISPDGSVAIRAFAVSPDGRWLAYLSAPGGADVGETHVREVSSGREHGDVIPDTWTSVCWTYDNAGFFYFDRPGGANAGLKKRLFYHKLGAPREQDRLIHEWEQARWLYAMMSDDGRRAIIVEEPSWMSIIDLGNAAHPDVSAPFVTLLGEVEANHTPMGTVGDTLYAFTYLEAPRGRVVALDVREGSAARPWTVIAEQGDVLQRATVAGNRIAVHYLHDVTSRLQLFTLAGKPSGEIALPGIGALGWALNGRHSVPELWYSFTSFLEPETVYHYDIASGKSTPFHAPKVRFDASAYETRQVFYSSQDGTRVPMFITAQKNIQRDAARPVLLTAYGGYGAIMAPNYQPDLPLWLEMGGIFVVANLRGGGEYGEEWHRAGNLERKQNSFDDFIAAAEHLVAERYTVPEKIAIYGHSNGGLLVGAMITQRPDLFAVALANAGHHDMLRYHRFTAGAAWIPEYGSSDQAADFRYLRAYSPLHNVHPGTCYPATILLTGDHDDRVVPSHSYKFAAALQAAQGCDRPILLRVASDASHSYASKAGAIAERSDMWAFVAAQLGVRAVASR